MFRTSYYGNTGNKHYTKSNDISPRLIIDETSQIVDVMGNTIYDTLNKTKIFNRQTYNNTFEWIGYRDAISFGENVNGGSMPIAEIRRAIAMERLNEWKKKFALHLQELNPIKLYFYNKFGIDSVRVISKDPLNETESFTKVYIDYLKENKDLMFDFLVFGEDEIDEESLPDDTLII